MTKKTDESFERSDESFQRSDESRLSCTEIKIINPKNPKNPLKS
jgi:hypothetical protein